MSRGVEVASLSPPMTRQGQFCGVFCPVDGVTGGVGLGLDACRGRGGADGQTETSQPKKKVQIRESKGKEALQNLDARAFEVPRAP
uniref:Uncharacterized protein n=1 Tax=Knipowitschia caucasica TaxID=637954 RepID=A0AAV2J0Z9_KNICA